MHVPGQCPGAAIAADLGGRERIGLVANAEAAMFFRNRDAEQACAVQVFVVLGRECRVAIIGGSAAGEYGLAELACSRNDRGLLITQPKRSWIEDRRIEGDVRRGCSFADWCRHHAATSIVFRNSSSAVLNACGRSRLTRWRAPSSST